MSIGSVEITISNGGWNGDYVIDPTGDLALSIDTLASQAASEERLMRLVMTCPLFKDPNGNPLTIPDDIFNSGWGAGAPFYVDDDPVAMQPQMKAGILNSIALDPTYLNSPGPTVTFQINKKTSQVFVFIRAQIVGGQPVTLGPQLIKPLQGG